MRPHWLTARTTDEIRLGLRRLAHGAPDASALHAMPETPGSLCQGSPSQILASQTGTSAGAANVVRLALWSRAHRNWDAQAFQRMLEAADCVRDAGGVAQANSGSAQSVPSQQQG